VGFIHEEGEGLVLVEFEVVPHMLLFLFPGAVVMLDAGMKL
jgi:hypothetical protein